MYHSLKLISLIGILSLNSCFRVDQEESNRGVFYPHDFPCEDIPPGGIIEDDYKSPDFTFKFPSFSPNNKNKICYVRIDMNTLNYELWTYDLILDEQEKLVDYVWYAPVWGKQNWIVFDRTDNQLWKVKSNGDSLTQLTKSGTNIYSDWNPDGTEIIFNSDVFPPGSSVLIINSNGDIIFKFDEDFPIVSHPTWSKDGNKLAYLGPGGLGYVSFPDSIHHFLCSVAPTGIYNISWTPDSKSVYWTDMSGINKIEIATGVKQVIKQSCESKTYVHCEVSPDGKRLVSDRIDSKRIDPFTIFFESYIYLMNPDGSEEVRIDLY